MQCTAPKINSHVSIHKVIVACFMIDHIALTLDYAETIH